MLGNEIRKRRKELGLTLKDLASLLGVSFAYVSQVERGEKKPTDKMLTKLEEVLNIKLKEIKEIDEMEKSELKELARNELVRRKARTEGVNIWSAINIMVSGDVFLSVDKETQICGIGMNRDNNGKITLAFSNEDLICENIKSIEIDEKALYRLK